MILCGTECPDRSTSGGNGTMCGGLKSLFLVHAGENQPWFFVRATRVKLVVKKETDQCNLCVRVSHEAPPKKAAEGYAVRWFGRKN